MLDAPKQIATQQYSYEVWQPNEENGRRFEFPLTEFDSNGVIRFSLALTAANALTTGKAYHWKDGQLINNPIPTVD